MSDRFQSLTVILDRPHREEELDSIVAAIRMMKGVADVSAGNPVGIEQRIANATIASELIGDLHDLLILRNGNAERDVEAWSEITTIAKRNR